MDGEVTGRTRKKLGLFTAHPAHARATHAPV